MIIIKVTAIC